MERFNRVLSGVENVLAAGTLALAAVISILNVILRQFDQSWFWTEEAVVYLIIFSTFIGAVVTLRHNEHVSVDILSAFMKARGRKVMALVAGLVTLAYMVIVGYFAWALIFEPFSRNTVTPVLKLPLWVVELAVPIGLTLMFLRTMEILWRTWRYGAASADADDVLAAEAEATGLSLAEIRASHDAITSGRGESLGHAIEHDEHRHRGRPRQDDHRDSDHRDHDHRDHDNRNGDHDDHHDDRDGKR